MKYFHMPAYRGFTRGRFDRVGIPGTLAGGSVRR